MSNFIATYTPNRWLACAAILLIVLLGTACTIAPPAPPVQQQTFAHLPRLNWQAAPPDIIYAPGLERAGKSALNPGSVVEHWVRDRLPFGGKFDGAATAKGIRVKLTVMAAAISETRSTSPGVVFEKQQVSLQGILSVKVDILLPTGERRETVIEARAVLNREGAISLNELDAGRFLVIQRLSTDFDKRMESYLRRQNIVF